MATTTLTDFFKPLIRCSNDLYPANTTINISFIASGIKFYLYEIDYIIIKI